MSVVSVDSDSDSDSVVMLGGTSAAVVVTSDDEIEETVTSHVIEDVENSRYGRSSENNSEYSSRNNSRNSHNNNNNSQEIRSGDNDVEIVQVVTRPPSPEVEIIRQQRAAIQFSETPLYLPGATIYTRLRSTPGLFYGEDPDDLSSSDDASRAATLRSFRERQRFGHRAPSRRHHIQTLNLLFQRGHFHGLQNEEQGEARLMRQVAMMESQELESKFENQKAYALPFKDRAENTVANLPEGYTSELSPDFDVVCPLCNVVLGVGIPDNFAVKTDANYLDEAVYCSEIQKYGCQAPYELVRIVTDIDRELSKKVYFAKCGHVYCGRCVQRIASRQSRAKKAPKNIENCQVYAPKKCVVDDCSGKLYGGRFVEVYTRL